MSHDSPKIMTLPQLSAGQDWRLTLAHDRPDYLLIWTTRGQGRLLLDGQRRGVGTHNLIVIPPRQLFALDLGRQGFGQAVVVPDGAALTLPQRPVQLRIREAGAISEFMALMEGATREQQGRRPLMDQALTAHGALIAVWLQRQLAMEEHIQPRPNAAIRLSAAYMRRITAHFHAPLTMADHAAALSVTPTHLTRACKAATGKTAADLLTERILYEARDLLTRTTVPAQDIARSLGFGSAAYFTRFMQHHTQATPSALRKAAARIRDAA
ncbi:helix-turn-helix domain-containing protein [Roseobacter weihaiensis]|uniref:helix-turn-helix domain-containing protein n=1 Tax=Roseobacter weihaiensis TaxID=2763262 RepID=UPI001D0B6BB2|nr:AraC family transcriptional regulator [Roseobacter sp. H9]